MSTNSYEILEETVEYISKFEEIEFYHLMQLDIILDSDDGSIPPRLRRLIENFSRQTSSERDGLIQSRKQMIRVIDRLPPSLKARMVEASNRPDASDELIPTFALERGERDRILELCERMRRIVFSASEFDQPHRVRLLNRIAAIEAETHKPEGMFDVVRGGIDDLGETLGKFGVNIKPLSDRMNEVVSIARRGTKAYDQLPEPEEVKQLPPPEDDSEEA